jgi:uncharacterized membrane protein
MEIFTQAGGEMLSRWGHYLAGVTWIGLLYYFNFVQTPAFAGFEAGARNESTAKLVPRALWWFRFGALLTVLTGLSILAFQENFDGDYFKSAPGISISTGILLALIMFANVWGIIWRNQKIVIANAQGILAGKEADPAAAAAARRGATASRTNTLFSIPMLFFMGATSHFSGSYDIFPSGGSRALYWIIVLVVVGVIEYIAISAPAAGAPQAWHIDQHKNTIIAGFVLAAFFILLWEIIF